MDEKDSNSFLPSTILNRGASGVEEEVLEAARECGLQVVLADSLPGESDEETVARMVSDSDATLVILNESAVGLEEKSPLSQQALEVCKKLEKPSLLLVRESSNPEDLLHKLRLWLIRHHPDTLHITGPTLRESRDVANLASYLLRRLIGKVPQATHDPFLGFACVATILAIIGIPILEKVYLESVRMDLLWPVILVSTAFAIWRGSLGALRFSIIYWALSAIGSSVETAYHLIRWVPYRAEKIGPFFPPNEKEFWIGLVGPGFLSLGILLLLCRVLRSRSIQLWTRSTRIWTAVVSLFVLFGLINVTSNPREEVSPALTASQRSDYQLIKEHFRQYGMDRRPAQEEELARKLSESGHIIRITAHSPSLLGWSLGPRKLLPIEKGSQVITHYSNGETKTEIVDSFGPLWTGHNRGEFIQTQSGDWVGLDVEIGTYTPREME
ncbi:putative molybdenum carrier protein [Roseibacillus persicicus]|uniref:putative molybdenum carrier protein n=1 Tax=Roseibacillus persicicus TaxID=454148 RepID=UPI00280E7FAE|nr:putative molybdenum carrier protein [Roseibacillus persicicus]MDQ8189963.1 putative molybdenum carrier protein [Roseibacillus persicicus]